MKKLIRALIIALEVSIIVAAIQIAIDNAKGAPTGFANEVLLHNCGPDKAGGPNVWAPDCPSR